MKKGILLWFGDYPDQRALACKLTEKFNVSGIVFERRERVPLRKLGFKIILEKVLSKLLLGELSRSWINLMNHYDTLFPKYPNVPILFLENINSQETIDFYNKHQSSLVLISGTRLIKEQLLNLKPEIGIINLHTGLSPYVKGGPNCTNWCLSNNTLHLIGNTIMWVDAGIDSGNLIATENVKFNGNENLDEIHIKVIEEAHQLYIRAVGVLLEKPLEAPNVPQNSVSTGVTYYTKMWGFKEKRRVIQNMKYFSKNIKQVAYENLVTIKLPES